uniref:Uncharacterized protein n=1 Tax=Arundo donax TaxID=35708 RepID=A0A0A9ECE3_ARUDO
MNFKFHILGTEFHEKETWFLIKVISTQ